MISARALLFPGALLRIFSGDPEVIRQGTTYIHFVAPFYVCFAVMFVSNGIINGAGHTLITTGIPAFSLLVIRVPAAYLLVHARHNVTGVWMAMGMSFAGSMVSGLLYYGSGRWKRPLTRPPEVLPLAPGSG